MAKLKDVRVELKAGPDDGLEEGEFTAYASVFGNKDSYGDVVVKGAFLESLAEWKGSGFPIPLLFGHNMADPDFNIGTASAEEDEFGLLTRGKLALDEPKAAQVYRLLKGRRINQMSFAYDILDGGWAKRTKSDGTEEEFYELRRLKLHEISVVPIGANQETSILSVKALEAVKALKPGEVTDSLKAEFSPLYDALGELLKGSKSHSTTADDGGPSKEEEPPGANSSKASPASVRLLAAELSLLDL